MNVTVTHFQNDTCMYNDRAPYHIMLNWVKIYQLEKVADKFTGKKTKQDSFLSIEPYCKYQTNPQI